MLTIIISICLLMMNGFGSNIAIRIDLPLEYIDRFRILSNVSTRSTNCSNYVSYTCSNSYKTLGLNIHGVCCKQVNLIVKYSIPVYRRGHYFVDRPRRGTIERFIRQCLDARDNCLSLIWILTLPCH